ncbi:MAG: FG-GAP repeat protein [Pyrinomonadaceae bacterium]|nr:FG-GAP repeat protein [Phycisphaerales bacterium]
MQRRTRSVDTRQYIEALEARALFSAYLYESINGAFDLPRLIHEFEGSEASGFGTSVAGVGDLDADGYDDFAISATGGLFGSPSPGGARVNLYSGQSGTLIRSITSTDYDFGFSLTNVGDVNEDGATDLLVGAPGYDGTDNGEYDPVGRAYIFSGADGAMLRTFEGTTAFGGFGSALARLNDANSDGIQDIIIGAPGYDRFLMLIGDPPLPTITGEVFILSGLDGSLIRSHQSEQPGDRFGSAIATAPDEGVDRQFFAVGASLHDVENVGVDAGRVTVFQLDGAVAHTRDGERAGDQLGAALAISVDQLSTPGTPGTEHRLVVGAPGSDFGVFGDERVIEDQGRIESFLLAGGPARAVGVALNPTANARMGATISIVGDLDYDGRNDLFVTAPGASQTYAFDANAQSIRDSGSSFASPVPDRIGALAIGSAGDVNDDGIPGIISTDLEGNVAIVSSLGAGAPIVISGTSENLRYMWPAAPRPILFIDGVARSYDHVPGLLLGMVGDIQSFTSYIDAIGNDGTIYFHNQNGKVERSDLMVLREGVTVTLESLVTSVVGDPVDDYSNLRIVRAGTGGHLLLNEAVLGPGPVVPSRTYIFSEGLLTSLWNGFVYDVNQSGAVVGAMADQSVIWTSSGGITAIPELTGHLGLNDAGTVVGTRTGTISSGSAGILASWAAGVVTEIGEGQSPVSSNSPPSWTILDVGNDGRVLARLTLPSMRGPFTFITYIAEPDADGLRRLADATHATPQGVPFGQITGFIDPAAFLGTGALANDGRILASNALLTPITDSEVGTLRADSPTASATIGQSHYITGINQYNELIVFFRDGDDGAWHVRRISDVPVPEGMTQLAMFTDEGTGLAYVVMASDTKVEVFSTNPGITEPGHTISGLAGRTAIVHGFTLFTNSVGIVHMAGFDAQGDLVIYYRNPGDHPTDADGWSFDNLTETHLTPQGLTTPNIVSQLTAYVTPWHGMNLAGLDADGHVHAIWWAPGNVLWRANNISESAGGSGSTEFVGQISAFVSPWGTMHLNMTDSSGHVAALWWSVTTEWQVTSVNDAGLTIDSESIASYVTPWGGLSVVGIQPESRRPVVYWWSPETQVWNTSELLLGVSDVPTFAGRLTARVEISDVVTQNIYGRGDDGSLLHLFWRPDGNPWSSENITAMLSE